jgi:gas vesicle protein
MTTEDRSTSGVVLSFLVGALTGAAVAILFAPRSGRETREMLGDRLRESAERGRHLGEEAIARGRHLGEQAMEKGRELAEDASTLMDRQREALERRRDRLAAAVDAGRQAFREEKEKS